MEVAADTADNVEAKQVENLLPPMLDVLEICEGLVPRVEQVPETAPYARRRHICRKASAARP